MKKPSIDTILLKAKAEREQGVKYIPADVVLREIKQIIENSEHEQALPESEEYDEWER